MNTATALDILAHYDGHCARAVDALMQFSRTAWMMAVRARGLTADALSGLENWEVPESGEPALVDAIVARKLLAGLAGTRSHIHLYLFQPVALVQAMLVGARPNHELRYFAMRSIRRRYRCILSHEIVHLFHLLADATNNFAAHAPTEQGRTGGSNRYWQHASVLEEHLESVLARSSEDGHQATQTRDAVTRDAVTGVTLFLECCRAVGYLLDGLRGEDSDKTDGDSVSDQPLLTTVEIDAELLLSRLFAMPTGVPGFDELLGGGGLILAEDLPADSRPEAGQAVPETTTDQLGGRMMLIMGRFGTGKTLLSLKLAVEVARKGGLAWVMPLEQSAEECLYMLEAVRGLPEDGSVLVATNIAEALRVLSDETPDRGSLIILKTTKESYDDFLEAFQHNAKRMLDSARQLNKYPLRLIIADPVNSVSRDDLANPAQLRTQTIKMIEGVKGYRTNVLLVAEEGSDSGRELLFEQNIADTVIRLSVLKRYGSAQRYFEIMKSRFQREQRGEHPYAIAAGVGIQISPSSAVVMANVRPFRRLPLKKPVLFGLPSLDDMLGDGALSAGNVIAIHGPEGTYRTRLGLYFLLASDQWPDREKDVIQKDAHEKDTHPIPGERDAAAGRSAVGRDDAGTGADLPGRRRISLLITAADEEALIWHTLSRGFAQTPETSKEPSDIIICSLARHFPTPSYLFERIEAEIRGAYLRGDQIDRLMVDDVSSLEKICPLLQDDASFGESLVQFLRDKGITSLLICGDISKGARPRLQSSVVDRADVQLQLNEFEFRGIRRVLIHVLKTRNMMHRQEAFELALHARGLQVKASTSLLRIGQHGELKPVNIQLFLHSETDMQAEYNNVFLHVVRAVLSRETHIESQDRVYMSKAMLLGSSSAVDELQILQLDEFQLPDIPSSGQQDLLHTLPYALWDRNEWKELETAAGQQIHRADRGFFAVPFYTNVGLLACHRDRLSEAANDVGFAQEAATSSWQALADACRKWERANPPHERAMQKGNRGKNIYPTLFFDFPRATPENYNCLFFEILLSFPDTITRLKDSRGRLFSDWQEWNEAVHSATLYRQLCRRSYLVGGGNDMAHLQTNEQGATIGVSEEAIVWRHWYTTLNQMMSKLRHEERERIRVSPLPGNVNVAGDWYLGVPAYSAAPDVGLQVIKLLTSREAEMDRLRMGVGLPIRRAFYETMRSTLEGDAAISPYFSMTTQDVLTLIDHGVTFRRSELRGYSKISKVLASTLQRIIEIPEGSDSEIKRAIRGIFRELAANIEFLDADTINA